MQIDDNYRLGGVFEGRNNHYFVIFITLMLQLLDVAVLLDLGAT